MGKPPFLIFIRAQPQPRLASTQSLSFSHTKNTYLAKQTNTQTHTWWSWWDQKCLSGEFVAVRWEISIISGVHLGAICWLPLRDRRRRGNPGELHSHTDTHLRTHCNAGQFVVAQERGGMMQENVCVVGGGQSVAKRKHRRREKKGWRKRDRWPESRRDGSRSQSLKKREGWGPVISLPELLVMWTSPPDESLHQGAHPVTPQHSHTYRLMRMHSVSTRITHQHGPPLQLNNSYCCAVLLAPYDFHMGGHGWLCETTVLQLQSVGLYTNAAWVLLRCQHQSTTHGQLWTFTTATFLISHRCHSC